MWDYDEKILKKTDPKTYLEKQVLYGMWHWAKIKKSMLKKYVDEINVKDDMRQLLYFLIDREYVSQYFK